MHLSENSEASLGRSQRLKEYFVPVFREDSSIKYGGKSKVTTGNEGLKQNCINLVWK